MSRPRPAIIGVGNVLMGDDGVGVAAIELLRERGLDERAQLIDAGLAFSEVLCDLQPEQSIIIIDAARGGSPAGSVYRLDVSDLDGRSGAMSAAVSLHEVGVLSALKMETLGGREFTDVTVFGVEPLDLRWREGLSAPVAEALERVVEAVCDYLDQRASGSVRACLTQRSGD